jgi:hypothetical protein
MCPARQAGRTGCRWKIFGIHPPAAEARLRNTKWRLGTQQQQYEGLRLRRGPRQLQQAGGGKGVGHAPWPNLPSFSAPEVLSESQSCEMTFSSTEIQPESHAETQGIIFDSSPDPNF